MIRRDGIVKIADFGLAAQLTVRKQRRNSLVGMVGYMAPELLRGENYDARVDIWSVGILVHELVDEICPFYEYRKPESVLKKIDRDGGVSKVKHLHSEAGRDFVNQCLSVDPNERPTAATLLNHAWFSEIPPEEDGSFLTPVVDEFRKKHEQEGGECVIV